MGDEDTYTSNHLRDEESNALGVSDVAKKLGYSDKRIREFLKDGRIKGKRVEPRGKWLVPISEVNRFRGELISSTKGQLEQKQQSEADAAITTGLTHTNNKEDPLILEARRQHFRDLHEIGTFFTESLNKFLSWALPAIDVMQGKTTEEFPQFPFTDWSKTKDWERCRINPLFACLKTHVPDNNLWQSHDKLCDLWDRYEAAESLIIDSLSGQKKLDDIKKESGIDPYNACEELLPQMPPLIRTIQDSVTIAISRGVFPGTCPACPIDYRT